MKKQYTTPSLTTYGSVDRVTGAFGGSDLSDTIFNSDGTVFGTSTGESGDAILVPCGNVNEPC